jgi:hypothetical protein
LFLVAYAGNLTVFAASLSPQLLKNVNFVQLLVLCVAHVVQDNLKCCIQNCYNLISIFIIIIISKFTVRIFYVSNIVFQPCKQMVEVPQMLQIFSLYLEVCWERPRSKNFGMGYGPWSLGTGHSIYLKLIKQISNKQENFHSCYPFSNALPSSDRKWY